MSKASSKNEYYLGNPNIPNKNWKGEWDGKKVKHLEKSKDNLLYFAENFFYIVDPDKGKVCIELFPYQKRILRTLRDNRRVILLASRQCGKALDVNTPIKTPTGWKTMGELKDGDQVYGLNGSPCNIVKAHDIMYDRVCYEVEFDNGEKIVADAEHNWFTQTRSDRVKGLSGSVRTTEDILLSLNTSQSKPNHRIPTCVRGLQGPNIDLTVDPYLIGLWLGDGCKDDCLNSQLRKYNLLNNKHIPTEFMYASREQRLKLLQGLMDSDGYINSKGTAQFYNTNIDLAMQVKELIESLGYKATCKLLQPTLYGRECAQCLSVSFTPREMVCTIPFKAKRIRVCSDKIDTKKRNQWNYIKRIVPVESRPVRCITVDSEDSLYLCGRSLITTHNTTCLTIYALWLACFFDYQNIVIVANKESTAIEIFRRVRLAYEEIHNYIKPGVKEYAKTSCEFDNGSRISISTTTGSAARGQSINCVTGDTYITIRNKVTGDIQTLTIAEFEGIIALNEKIQTKSNGLDMINHVSISNIEFEVLTDEGFRSFEGLIIGENNKKLRIEFSNSTSLRCTPKQKIFLSVDKTVYAKDLQVGDTVFGDFKVISIHLYEDVEKVYDLLEVKDNHRYYANNILVHQCLLIDECAFIEPESILEDFWRSVFPTLSRSKKSKVLIASTPNGTGNLFHKLYEGSERGENGFVTEKVPWYDIPGRDEKWKQEQLAALGSVESFLQEYECVHGSTLVDITIDSEYNQTTIAELYSLV